MKQLTKKLINSAIRQSINGLSSPKLQGEEMIFTFVPAVFESRSWRERGQELIDRFTPAIENELKTMGFNDLLTIGRDYFNKNIGIKVNDEFIINNLCFDDVVKHIMENYFLTAIKEMAEEFAERFTPEIIDIILLDPEEYDEWDRETQYHFDSPVRYFEDLVREVYR